MLEDGKDAALRATAWPCPVDDAQPAVNEASAPSPRRPRQGDKGEREGVRRNAGGRRAASSIRRIQRRSTAQARSQLALLRRAWMRGERELGGAESQVDLVLAHPGSTMAQANRHEIAPVSGDKVQIVRPSPTRPRAAPPHLVSAERADLGLHLPLPAHSSLVRPMTSRRPRSASSRRTTPSATSCGGCS